MNFLHTSPMRALRRRWPRIKRVLPVLILIVVAGLLYYFGRTVDWPKVWVAMREIPGRNIAIAGGLVVVGYLAYGSLDLLGKKYTRHNLPAPKALGVAMLSYALNLNLGVLVGGLGARLRLYTRLGCRKSVATRVALFAAASNWIGYAWLAGVLFALGVVPVPAGWEIGSGMLRLLGLGLLALGVAYVTTCARAKRRSATWMGHHITLPSARMAVAQCCVAALSWSIMGAIAYVLLQGKASYPAVLGILLCTSFASVITRVPGGLGTTEAIFVAALGSQIPPTEVLGAALAYRAVYALAPLCLALAAYPLIELRLGMRRGKASDAPPGQARRLL
ncbi:lysylphosphatidylglycerol synthase domain-containing protein [Achromobacter sp.]|uniref:lysylphosphatidylglycerol synthase domain-containing protein n=1 Tax=Achromobacter sp. TaxID=134375 RepID=UPI0028A9EDC9|nr:lysylphosphatidylglycerol synthase domain-containing protein [Achromobacter sp.]